MTQRESITAWMEIRGLTAEQVVARAQEQHERPEDTFSWHAMNAWISGARTNIKTAYQVDLAAALEITVDQLIHGPAPEEVTHG
ncbi:MAG: hypothetical protein AMXMBFR84_26470 [Candidatus Hydrogenedentota bacterium]